MTAIAAKRTTGAVERMTEKGRKRQFDPPPATAAICLKAVDQSASPTTKMADLGRERCSSDVARWIKSRPLQLIGRGRGVTALSFG